MFDWEEFKKGKIAVHCDTEEKAKDFVDKCYEKGISFFFSRKEETCYSCYREQTCYIYDCYNLMCGKKQLFIADGFNVIKWETEEMTNTEKILDIIGLKVGEKFQTNRSNQIYWFNEELELLYGENAYSNRAIEILNGSLEIIKLPIINDNDKEILNFYAKRGYKWFACDESGEHFAYKTSPLKSEKVFIGEDNYDPLLPEPLSFLKWEDEPFYWECE